MKILIVEDDFTSRFLLQQMLQPYGTVQIAVNGREALDAFKEALETGEPYKLICLDIMMPEMDGHTVLEHMREFERQKGIEGHDGVKVFMTSALSDGANVFRAFREQCEAYLVKPLRREDLIFNMQKHGLI